MPVAGHCPSFRVSGIDGWGVSRFFFCLRPLGALLLTMVFTILKRFYLKSAGTLNSNTVYRRRSPLLTNSDKLYSKHKSSAKVVFSNQDNSEVDHPCQSPRIECLHYSIDILNLNKNHKIPSLFRNWVFVSP